MAHVHGAASAAKMGNSAVQAVGHGMSGMSQQGMGEMMGHAAKGVAVTGAVVAAKSALGKSVVHKILGNPWVLFGLGVAVGYSIHKYRKEIIESANRATEKTRDFVLQQRENLEDLVAETRETDN